MSMRTLAARMQHLGGDQLGRINQQKLYGLRQALKNDYNSRMIKVPNGSAWPALINGEASGLKSDYDKKTVSVEFESGLEAGDVFEILEDGTHWMVYLPVITETAYLQSEIIRCRYQLEVDGETYWIYFQGPTETDLRWFIKQGTNINELNLSGTVYIKNTPATKAFFKRFTHIELDGHTWEVQVTDSITVPGIIELEVQEYYDNFVDDLPKVVKVGCQEQILGETVVRQDTEHGYRIEDDYYDPRYEWSIEGNPRVRVKEVHEDGKVCTVRVEDGAIRGFKVVYGDRNSGYHLDVKIDISEPEIEGPAEVYPYDTPSYTIKNNRQGVFHLETRLAKITEREPDACKLNIVTGKKGSFTLYFKDSETGETFELPIEIKSF